MLFEQWVKVRLAAAGMTQAQLAREIEVDAGIVNRAIHERDDAVRARIRARLEGVRVDGPIDGETRRVRK